MNTQILARLRQLKLPAMAEALDTQLEQVGAYEDLPFLERLGLLIEHEALSREHRKHDRLIAQARFKLRAHLQDIDYEQPRNFNKSQIARLGQGEWIERAQNLLITGPCGSGKTYLGCALGHSACLLGHSVRYYRLSRLLMALTQAKADGTYAKQLRALSRTRVLLIDLCDVASYVELAAQSGAQANSGRIVLNINDVVDHSVYLSIVPIWRLLCSPNFSRRYIVDTNNQRSRLILRISRLGCWQRATRATIPAITCSDFAKRSRAVST